MTSTKIFATIEKIGATSSKLEKEAIVKANIGDKDFARVLKATYDPTVSYGIKKVPAKATKGGVEFDVDTWRMLAAMSDRKLTGNDMIEAVQSEMNKLDEESAELLRRILIKDMRAGFSESTIIKADPTLIPDFPYMRCCLPKDAKLDEFDWAAGVVSQEKADGMFVNVNHYADGRVSLHSRAGSVFPTDQFEKLVAAVKNLHRGTQTHGELLVFKTGESTPLARELGNGMLNSVLQGGEFEPGHYAHLMVWDQIPLSAVKTKGKYDTAYSVRLASIVAQLKSIDGPISLIETRTVKSRSEAMQHYAELLAKGKEGTIIKNPHAIWKDGTSKEQVKMKLEVDCDLKVVDFEAGSGKNASTFGSLVCSTECGDLIVAVSGFTDKKRAEIWGDRDRWIGKIVTVKANGIMTAKRQGEKHSLFLPRFVEERLDKRRADDMATVKKQFESAIKVK